MDYSRSSWAIKTDNPQVAICGHPQQYSGHSQGSIYTQVILRNTQVIHSNIYSGRSQQYILRSSSAILYSDQVIHSNIYSGHPQQYILRSSSAIYTQPLRSSSAIYTLVIISNIGHAQQYILWSSSAIYTQVILSNIYSNSGHPQQCTQVICYVKYFLSLTVDSGQL